MTEREAISKLAELVATVAARCWEALGTSEARRINQECFDIVKSLEPTNPEVGE